MPRPKPTEPMTLLQYQCPVALRNAFVAAANACNMPAALVARMLMQDFVHKQKRPAVGA